MFCSDPMSGSHFIAQTSKFLLIDATVAILGQGHRKVTQYISPDSKDSYKKEYKESNLE